MQNRIEIPSLKNWLSLSTRDEKEALAAAATNGSVPQLYHLSSGERSSSALKAGYLADASVALHAKNPALPILTRMELCTACAQCDYAIRCSSDELI